MPKRVVCCCCCCDSYLSGRRGPIYGRQAVDDAQLGPAPESRKESNITGNRSSRYF